MDALVCCLVDDLATNRHSFFAKGRPNGILVFTLRPTSSVYVFSLLSLHMCADEENEEEEASDSEDEKKKEDEDDSRSVSI